MKMRRHSRPEGFVFAVSHSKFLTGLLHERRDSGIMDVADFGKQMVFDLKVQAAQQPRCYAAAPSEVHSSFNLMYSPRVFDSPSVWLRQRKLRGFYAVRQLKNNTEHQPEHNRCRTIEEHYNPKAMKQQWDYERYGEKASLASDEHDQVPALRSWQLVLSDSARNYVAKITDKVPVDRHNTI